MGRVTSNRYALGESTSHQYDAAGRRTQTRDALGNITLFAYDSNGNLSKQTDAKSQDTVHRYNALDQRIETEFDDGSSTETVFDALGRQAEAIDQNGRKTQYTYDALARLTSVTDALNQVTRYSYDEAGNKLSQTDAMGRTTRWAYDAMGRELSRILPLGQEETHSYDIAGNPTSHTDFNGNSHSFIYDTDTDRLLSENYFDGSTKSYQYNAMGQRISATDSLGSYLYSYDSQQRLISETKPDGHTLEYTYDDAGNKLSFITTVNGTAQQTDYSYDALNRLATVIDTNGNHSYNYDAVGNRASTTYSNGTHTDYSYDNLNRLTNVTHLDAPTNTLASFTYTLDATGRRAQIIEDNGRTTHYSYDELYRLTDESISDTINGDYSASYQYDAVGNRLFETVNASQTAYTYDENGNTLTESVDSDLTHYAWNSENRLTSSAAQTTAGLLQSTFVYDIDNNRVEKTVDNNGQLDAIDFVIDNNQDYAQVVQELYANTAARNVSYTFGSDLLSQTRAGQLQIYHYDGLGSTRLLTDNSSTTTDLYDYEAFGEVLNQAGSSENDYLYTGEQFDAELDQYYLRARYYDVPQSRFMSLDTFSGKPAEPITQNKFLYSHSDPVNMTDPSGHNANMMSVSSATSVMGTLAVRATPLIRPFALRTKGTSALSTIETGSGAILSMLPPAAALALLNMSKVDGEVHGNSKNSKKRQHLYRIDIAVAPDIYKYGISGSQLNKNGSSPRANSQVNFQNKIAGFINYSAKVIHDNIRNRVAALAMEYYYVCSYNKARGRNPWGNRRPICR